MKLIQISISRAQKLQQKLTALRMKQEHLFLVRKKNNQEILKVQKAIEKMTIQLDNEEALQQVLKKVEM